VLDVDRHGTPAASALRQLKAAGIVGRAAALVRPVRRRAPPARRAPAGQRQPARPSSTSAAAGGCVLAHPRRWWPLSWSAARPAATPIDWAKVREHLEPQRERQWQPPARLRNGGQNLDHLVAQMADQPEGNRNGFLHWAANRVLDHGQDERLPELANAAVAAGLDRREADRTIESARRTERQDPHATPQPGRPARLAPPRDPAPRPVARREPTERQEPGAAAPRLEADRDGPQVPERPEPRVPGA
jgi:hypothetical protein